MMRPSPDAWLWYMLGVVVGVAGSALVSRATDAAARHRDVQLPPKRLGQHWYARVELRFTEVCDGHMPGLKRINGVEYTMDRRGTVWLICPKGSPG